MYIYVYIYRNIYTQYVYRYTVKGDFQARHQLSLGDRIYEFCA